MLISTAKFTTISFPVPSLLGQIETGQIGLPELQRPFVWSRAQVRDLLDSLYRGFPAGYFLLWQATPDAGATPIGAGRKKSAASLLVVDGQQRLTSWYAVFKGAPVFTERLEKEIIRLAFHPLKERFDVANSATDNDPEWISDISPLLNGRASVYSFINEYIQRLSAIQELSPLAKDHIASNVQRLVPLKSYNFTAIQLTHDLAVEEVAEIFVRINSKGTQLDHGDFLTTTIITAIDAVSATRCKIGFEIRENKTECVVYADRATKPVFADTDNGKRLFYVRAGTPRGSSRTARSSSTSLIGSGSRRPV